VCYHVQCLLLYPLFRSVIHVSLGFVSQEIYHYILFVLFFSPVNASPLRHFLLCAKPDSRLDWKNSFPFILIIWFLLAMYFENYQRQVFHVNPKPGSAGTCLKLELRQGADIQSLKRDGTRAETRFRLSAKRTSPFQSAGASVQSTTGSRGVHISGSNAGYTMFRGSVKSTGYPLHLQVSP